ncbi:glycosyltransferase family 2 protein [Flavobacterium covae]|nr:glycosyltransferase family A protein [Flavobacterium covae]QYS90674.1 glycosyltransferase family 2 protein [Flavobacterium covae]
MQKNTFLFSVIIPLYNKENYIYNTLISVINQTYTYFEIIIVNDGSTDKSLEIVKNINDSRIKIFEQNNKGVSSARNLGIKNATGSLIAFLDADDLWKKIIWKKYNNFTHYILNVVCIVVDIL